jgi:O-antigen/teichoic acid export membrane protein
MLARKTLFVIIKEGIAGILGFVTLFVVARYMGAEPLGVVGFAVAFINVFNIIADMGLNAAHVKRVSEGKDIKKCIAVFIRFKLILTVAGLLIMCLFLLIIDLLGMKFYDATYPEVIFIMILYFIITQVMAIPKFTFDAKLQIYRGQISALAGVIAKDVFVISAAILLTMGAYGVLQKSVALATGYVIEVLVACILLLWFFMREEKIGKYDAQIARSYLKFALPFFPVAIFALLAVSADRLTIGYFWNAAEVGYYVGVQQIANMLVVIQSAATLVLFPAVSSAHKKGEQNEVVRISSEAIRYILLILMPVGAGITVFSAHIIHVVLSDEFLSAEYCFIILTWYYILFSVSNTIATTIGGTDRPKLGAKITLVSAITNISLNFVFVPFYGATGAAIATLISGIVYFILVWYFSTRILHHNIVVFRNLKIVFAGVVTILCTSGLRFWLFPEPTNMRIYVLIPVLGFVVGIFALLCAIMGELTKDEFKFVKNVLHIGEMRRSIKEELKTKNKR